MRTVLTTARVVATERIGGELVAHAVIGEDTYAIRGADWIRAGMCVRLVVERAASMNEPNELHERAYGSAATAEEVTP